MTWLAFCCAPRQRKKQPLPRVRMMISTSNPRFWTRKTRGIAAAAILALLAGASALLAQKTKRDFQLHADTDEFWSLLDRNGKLATVGNGFGFTEGPVWDPSGFVYVSDEEINKIFRLYPDGHKEELIALGDPDGNTYDRQQRLIDCA